MSATSGWWRHFFEGPVVDFWLRAPMESATKEEAAFVAESLGVAPGRGCSTSRAAEVGTRWPWRRGAST